MSDELQLKFDLLSQIAEHDEAIARKAVYTEHDERVLRLLCSNRDTLRQLYDKLYN